MGTNSKTPLGVSKMSIRDRGVSFGYGAFPSSSAGTGKVDRDGLYQCKQCGFVNDKSLVQSPGKANEGDGGISISVSDSVGDPTVTDYCPFCGSPNNR